MMQFDITSFVLGVLLGGLALGIFVFPRVLRILTRIASVILLGSGVGLLSWSLDALLRVGELRPMGWERLNISTPSEAIGWGTACLVAGTLALILSFFATHEPR